MIAIKRFLIVFFVFFVFVCDCVFVCVSRNRICICIVCTGCCQERFSVLHQDPVWVGCLLMCQVMVGGIQGGVELHNMPIQVALSQEDAFRSPFSWVFITILSEKTLTLFQMFLLSSYIQLSFTVTLTRHKDG